MLYMSSPLGSLRNGHPGAEVNRGIPIYIYICVCVCVCVSLSIKEQKQIVAYLCHTILYYTTQQCTISIIWKKNRAFSSLCRHDAAARCEGGVGAGGGASCRHHAAAVLSARSFFPTLSTFVHPRSEQRTQSVDTNSDQLFCVVRAYGPHRIAGPLKVRVRCQT